MELTHKVFLKRNGERNNDEKLEIEKQCNCTCSSNDGFVRLRQKKIMIQQVFRSCQARHKHKSRHKNKTIEQTIPVTTEEEAIPVPVAPGEVNVSSSSSASASIWQLHRHRLYRQKIATSREMKKFMRHKRLIFARQLRQMQQRQDLLRRVHPFTE